MFVSEKKILWYACRIFILLAVTFTMISPVEAEEGPDGSREMWDGEYVGLAAGFSYATADPVVRAKGNGYFVTTDPGQTDPEGSDNLEEGNLSGTIFCGVNSRFDDIVFGVEIDFMLAGFKKEHHSGNITYITQPAHTFAIESQVTSDWMVSMRPRLGYAFDRSLVFVSAGPAFSRFGYTFKFTDTFGPEFTEVNESNVKVGWTAGAGYEYGLPGGWGIKAEYLHYDFQDIVDSDSFLSTVPADGFSHDLDFQADTFRIGVFKMF